MSANLSEPLPSSLLTEKKAELTGRCLKEANYRQRRVSSSPHRTISGSKHGALARMPLLDCLTET